MQFYSFKNYQPNLDESNFIAPGAVVIGQVTLGKGVSIWFNSVVRGDVNQIIIGEHTNIQDLSMLHVTDEFDLVIGKNVTVGHSVVLHGCDIGDGCLIGMGAKVLDGARIGENCLVAAGSVVPPGKVYPPGSLILGSPAVVKKTLSEEEQKNISEHYKSYLNYANDFNSEKLQKFEI